MIPPLEDEIEEEEEQTTEGNAAPPAEDEKPPSPPEKGIATVEVEEAPAESEVSDPVKAETSEEPSEEASKETSEEMSEEPSEVVANAEGGRPPAEEETQGETTQVEDCGDSAAEDGVACSALTDESPQLPADKPVDPLDSLEKSGPAAPEESGQMEQIADKTCD